MSTRRSACSILLALAAIPAAGCRLLDETTKAPATAVMSVVPGSKLASIDPAELQFEIQRYADDLATRSIASIDEYVRRLDTDEARSQGLRWRLGVTAAAVSLAGGPNPIAGIVDLLAVTTIMRSELEEHWVKTPQGPAFEPWLASCRSLEADIWKLAEQVVTIEQQEELRRAIRNWQESNPGIQQ